MKLIIDCGSTKADYAVRHGAEIVGKGTVTGMNPALCTDAAIRCFFGQMAGLGPFDEVEYYGAGCLPGEVEHRVKAGAMAALNCASVSAASDMLGAAKALLGNRPGIAAILGTGSNSCLYDGSRIVDNVPSLGYVLGDEGSGNHMGRTLLTRYFKRRLSSELAEAFHLAYPDLDIPEVVRRVYRSDAPNAWLAGFARFLSDHIDKADACEIVEECLRAFVRNALAGYGSVGKTMPVGFVGSVAAAFAPQLSAVLALEGYTLGRILSRPIEGLAAE